MPLPPSPAGSLKIQTQNQHNIGIRTRLFSGSLKQTGAGKFLQ